MKKILLATALAASFSGAGNAAIVTTPLSSTLTPTDLVNVLLSGNSGITVSNVQYTGAQTASGRFAGGTPIGFANGIVLSSGSVASGPDNIVEGPNNDDGTTVENGQPGDVDLDGLTTDSTEDASVLSFNFVPTGNRVTFSYVFGSEEYNEFVNSQFNDVFGFFINGVNVAVLPGTNTPVAINNVNCGFASSGNPAPGAGPNCTRFRDNTTGAIDTELDGLTTVLFIDAAVNAGQTNTMKIAIADVGDQLLDSAVLFQGGTFTVCGGPNQPACTGGGGGNGNGNVPEPMSLALLGIGLAGLRIRSRKN